MDDLVSQVAQHAFASASGDHPSGVPSGRRGTTMDAENDWRSSLAELPLEQRLKAIAAYELARDRAAGQSPQATMAIVEAAGMAEGLDTSHDRIRAAAEDISAARDA